MVSLNRPVPIDFSNLVCQKITFILLFIWQGLLLGTHKKNNLFGNILNIFSFLKLLSEEIKNVSPQCNKWKRTLRRQIQIILMLKRILSLLDHLKFILRMISECFPIDRSKDLAKEVYPISIHVHTIFPRK